MSFTGVNLQVWMFGVKKKMSKKLAVVASSRNPDGTSLHKSFNVQPSGVGVSNCQTPTPDG